MAYSIRSRRRVHALGAALAFALAPGVAAAAAAASTEPINLEAASSDFDYRNGRLQFKRVRITQGDMSVEAAEASATGLEFENSEWRFNGDVKIKVRGGELESSEATVAFRDNEIVRARAVGGPARFRQVSDDPKKRAQGHASTIEYDVGASTVQLNGAAWLTDGQNEIRGATLVYDIGRERVRANPGQSEPGGVRITIRPSNGTGTVPPSKPPATDTPPEAPRTPDP
jgi:lipopolysaccharide transport protein LptA